MRKTRSARKKRGRATLYPLLGRELVRESRRFSHFAFRTLLLAVLVTFAIVTWRSVSNFQIVQIGLGPSPFGGPAPQALLAQYGAGLFGMWAVGLFIAASLYATLRGAQLADERRVGALPMLRITALGDGGVISGWFASIMMRVLMLLTLTIPILVIVQSCGGFTLWQIFSATTIILIAAAHAGALTLLIASLLESSYTAIAISLAIQWLLPSGLFVLLGGHLPGMGEEETLLHLFLLLRHSLDTTLSNEAIGWMVSAIAPRVVLIGVWLLLARWFLRLSPLRPSLPFRMVLAWMDRFFMKLSSNKWLLWRGGLGRCGRNPVYWRERAVSLTGRSDALIRIIYLTLMAVLLIGILAFSFGYEIMLVLLGLHITLLFGLALIVPPASSMPTERQKGSLPLLAVTPLSAGRIVRGKYLFCLRQILVPLAIIGLVIAVFFSVEMHVEAQEVVTVVHPFIFVPLISAVVFFIALPMRTPGRALLVAVPVFFLLSMLILPDLPETEDLLRDVFGWHIAHTLTDAGDIRITSDDNFLGIRAIPLLIHLSAVCLLIPTWRVARNVLVLLLPAPFLLSGSEGRDMWDIVEGQAVLVVIPSSIALFVLKERWLHSMSRWLILFALLAVGCVSLPSAVCVPLALCFCLAYALAHEKHAGPNRVLLALVAAVCILKIAFAFFGEMPELSPMISPLIVILGTLLFLRLSESALDRFMERNG